MPASTTRSSVSATTSGGCTARLQQWPHTTRPAKRRRQHRAREVGQRPGADVAALVAVQVDVEATLGRQVEQPIEQRVDLRGHVGDRTEDPAGRGHAIRQLIAFGAPNTSSDQRHRLQLDPPGPRLAEPLDTRARRSPPAAPMNRGACGWPSCRARSCTRARSPCAGARPRPTSGPCGRRHGADRAVERAVGVGGALPGVALVEVGVEVDQARPHLAAPEVDARRRALGAARPTSAPDRPAIAARPGSRGRRRRARPKTPACRGGCGQERRGDGRVAQPVLRLGRESRRSPAFTSSLAPDRALVPLPQHQVRQRGQRPGRSGCPCP